MDSKIYAQRLTQTVGASELAFSRASYERRLATVRDAMAAHELDLLLITHACDLNYLTGYDTLGVDIYACLVLPAQAEPILHAMTVEIPAATVTTWLDDVVFMDWFLPGETGAALADLLAARGLNRGRIGVQPARHGLRPDVLEALRAKLSSASIEDASDLVARVRLYKTPEEIECLRKAGAITAVGIEGSLAAIACGATDNEVCAAGFSAMLAAGSDMLAIQPIITTGPRTGGGHQTHRRFTIRPSDAVFMEYGGCFKRYTAPLMRSAVLGEPPAEMRRLERAAVETTQALIDNLKPGRSAHDVALAGRAVYDEVEPLCYFSGAYGYTIGVGYPPTWADTIAFIAEGVEEEIKPGMTFHLPTSMRIRGATV